MEVAISARVSGKVERPIPQGATREELLDWMDELRDTCVAVMDEVMEAENASYSITGHPDGTLTLIARWGGNES